jgi:hypothetical protein
LAPAINDPAEVEVIDRRRKAPEKAMAAAERKVTAKRKSPKRK